MPGIIISIHAPVKGATYYEVTHNGDKGISIHAPVKGATKTVLATSSCSTYFNPRTREGCDARHHRRSPLWQYFNPRTREGCDIYEKSQLAGADAISIHAPVKGATGTIWPSVWTGSRFQSTHP